jgi:hypothetical protein
LVDGDTTTPVGLWRPVRSRWRGLRHECRGDARGALRNPKTSIADLGTVRDHDGKDGSVAAVVDPVRCSM